jgi:molybdopterin-containing oxidoreductase family iron-sulfur binding subunit
MEFNLNRRAFIKTMGGVGLATLFACDSKPIKRIVSHVTPQQELIPGVVTWYASVCRECPAGCGIVVATREGRPVKIEGNPLHPVNNGRLCARGQAALQGLYNPDRVIEPLKKVPNGDFESVSWNSALDQLSEKLIGLKESGSFGRAALVTPHISGSLSILLDEWTKEDLGVEIYEYEPISYESIEMANEICFGRRSLPLYDFRETDLVVSFGADFLETWISPVKYASDFAEMRTYHEGKMGRLLYFGPRQSLTAANADEVVMIKAGSYGALALGMIRILLEENRRTVSSDVDLNALGNLVDGYDPKTVFKLTGVAEDRLRHLTHFIAKSYRSVILPGGLESNGTNATENTISVNLLNYYLGNYGKTIDIPSKNPYPNRNSTKGFSQLIEKMAGGEIKVIMFYNINPVYSIPPSSGILDAIKEVETVVTCSSTHNETTDISDYVLPVHSPLESWGDYTPTEGIYGLMQPMIRPLGDSKHFGDVLLGLSELIGLESSKLSKHRTYYEFVVNIWKDLARTLQPESSFRDFWENTLRRGGFFKARETSPVKLSEKAYIIDCKEPLIEGPGEIEIDHSQKDLTAQGATLIVYPSMIHYDGRGANRPWLQELQDPLHQRVWGSYIEVSRQIADNMDLKKGDVLKVTSPYGTFESPHYVSNLSYENVIAVATGQGHNGYGRFAKGIGVNPVELLPFSFDELSGQGVYLSVHVTLEKAGRRVEVPSPEGHPYDEDRGIAQTIGLTSLRNLTSEEQNKPPHRDHEFKELLNPHDHPKHRWGMVIDLNACIGCGACVVACYAENNISVVGEKQYLKGREMTWIRIERYYDKSQPGNIRFIPIPCQHCDNAPCEPVCPVYATYHTPEGLNAQIYNRCVGTRYCANNCPYNVRRYNWYTYKFSQPLNLQLNPDVTVRSKGVMEKCTFCVQRIVMAKNRAKDENRGLRDGEIIPACGQTCPTRAITFGDLNDPDTDVSVKARSARGYRILEQLNTKPAITYLKKITRGDGIG